MNFEQSKHALSFQQIHGKKWQEAPPIEIGGFKWIDVVNGLLPQKAATVTPVRETPKRSQKIMSMIEIAALAQRIANRACTPCSKSEQKGRLGSCRRLHGHVCKRFRPWPWAPVVRAGRRARKYERRSPNNPNRSPPPLISPEHVATSY